MQNIGTILLLLLSATCWGNNSKNGVVQPEPRSRRLQAPAASTVLDVLLAQDDLSLFASAVDSTFLTRTLRSNRRNYTVIAPTNDGLVGLDPKYYTPPWMVHLESILGYHIVLLRYLTSGDLAGITELNRGGVNAPWNITNEATLVLDNGLGPPVSIVQVDLLAGNGVVHKLDGFMVPTVLTVNLLEVASSLNFFSIVLELVASVGLEEELTSQDVTLFAPANQYFSQELLVSLEASPDATNTVVRYHAVPEVYPISLLTDGLELSTLLEGETLMVSNTAGTISINEIPLGSVGFDAPGSNGLAQPITGVIIPKSVDLSAPIPTPAPVLETVLQVLSTEPDLSQIAAAVTTTYFAETLSSSRRNYTFFAPTNEGLANLDPKFFTPNWIIHLEAILGYHILSGSILNSTNVAGAQQLDRFGVNVPWNITVDNSEVTIDNGLGPPIPVVGDDLLAKNGVVHKLGGFLVPTVLSFSLVEAAGFFDFYSIVLELVVSAGLEEEFSQEVTLFAPPNDVFSEELLASLTASPDATNTVVRYHAVPEVYPTSLLTDGLELPTLLEGETLMVSNTAGAISINEILLAPLGVDAPGSNGLAQPIASVLLPESLDLSPPTPTESAVIVSETVLDVLFSESDLSLIAGAVNSTFLKGALSSSRRNYTLFAPTDDGLGDLDPKFLTPNWIIHREAILRYHIIFGRVLTSSHLAGRRVINRGAVNAQWSIIHESPTTSVEETAAAQEDGMASFILDNGFGPPVPVVGVDFLANNGVVHKLGGFMVPKVLTVSLLDVASNVDAYSTVVELVALAGLEEELRKDVTLFAPSNDVFSGELLASLLDSPDATATVLSYHVVPGVYPTPLLVDGSELSTLLEGETLAISNVDGVITINEIPLASEETDTAGSNGLVQPILGVLVPASLDTGDTTANSPPTGVPNQAPTDDTLDENEEAPVEAPVDAPVAASPIETPVAERDITETSSSLLASAFSWAPLSLLWP